MIKQYFSKSGFLLVVSFFTASSAVAVPLSGSYDSRGSFVFPQGDVSQSSYDGASFNAFTSFSTFTTPDLLKLNSFTGQPLGSQLEVTLLSESAAFDGSLFPSYANKFGVLNSSSNFTTLLDSTTASAGSSATFTQGASESLTFALISPEGTFSSIDVNNPDGQAHILGKVVDKAGTFTISPTSLYNTAALTFNFEVGDIILFIEDMQAAGNVTNFIVPGIWDADFNDMVVVIRQTALPEPSTVVFMALGLLALAYKKRKQQADIL